MGFSAPSRGIDVGKPCVTPLASPSRAGLLRDSRFSSRALLNHLVPGLRSGQRDAPRRTSCEPTLCRCVQTEALASSAVRASAKLGATLIVAFTKTGRTPGFLAKYRSSVPILAVRPRRLRASAAASHAVPLSRPYPVPARPLARAGAYPSSRRALLAAARQMRAAKPRDCNSDPILGSRRARSSTWQRAAVGRCAVKRSAALMPYDKSAVAWRSSGTCAAARARARRAQARMRAGRYASVAGLRKRADVSAPRKRAGAQVITRVVPRKRASGCASCKCAGDRGRRGRRGGRGAHLAAVRAAAERRTRHRAARGCRRGR